MKSISNPLARNSSFKELSLFFEGTAAEDYIKQQEQELWLQLGGEESRVDTQMSMLEKRVEQARMRWACISAKSQREKKIDPGVRFDTNIYSGLTTVQPKYDRATHPDPPDRSGKPVFNFSEKSCRRMMQKSKKMNREGLPLPYFVTLTYKKNYRNCKRSKDHLNAFLERWRKRHPDFAYFWKLEAQKRGAIHYHLAMFIPESLQRLLRMKKRKKLQSYSDFSPTKLDAMKLTVQKDWAQVSVKVDHHEVQYTCFDYIRKHKTKNERYQEDGKARTVSTKCANPEKKYKLIPDFEHEWYGTNVREVYNWRMFTGYMMKYLGKENPQNPFGLRSIILQKAEKGYPAPPALPQIKIELDDCRIETGRFWGFSYNLDFEALQTGINAFEDRKTVNEFCNVLNVIDFKSTIRQLKGNAKRAKKQYPEGSKELKKALKKCRNTFEAQKRRFEINKDKINKGYMLQFDVKAQNVIMIAKYLHSESVEEWFG